MTTQAEPEKVKGKKSGSKSKKTSENVQVNQVVETPVVVEPVVVEPAVVDSAVEVQSENKQVVLSEESNTEILFNKLINQFSDIQLVMKTLHSNLKILQKEVLREKKESKKRESKFKKKGDKKKNPSGFAKPSPITSDLSNFLGIPEGQQIARTDVTTKVIAYVKEHNLQNPADKREIIPDEKLKKLLEPGDLTVTFFNLQTHLKKHFLAQTVESTVETTVEPTVV